MNSTSSFVTFWGLLIALSSIQIASDLVYLFLFCTVLLCMLIALAKSPTALHARLNCFKKFSLRIHGSAIEIFALKYLSNCWWVVMLTWVYGFSLAQIEGVPLEHSTRNFFGLLAYITVPLLIYSKICISKVVRLIIFSALLQLLFLSATTIQSFDHILTSSDINSLSELRVTYSLGALIIIPIVSVSVASAFYGRKRFYIPYDNVVVRALLTKTSIFVLLFYILVPSMSKGLFLIVLLIVLASLIPASLARIRLGFIPNYVFYLIFLVALVIGIVPQGFWNLISYTFSDEDLSNSLRNEQFGYLFREFSFWGSGLGNSLKSGYVRDDTGYGFELNYLNVIHKLGIFSLPLFISYIATIYVVILRIIRKFDMFNTYFALGLVAFLVQGAANPVLLSPVSVILHSCAIYILLNCGSADRSCYPVR